MSSRSSPEKSFCIANNFWGKEDAGVSPLLDRMTGAKQTCDELKSFYSARASIEDEYARKLLSLCRKSLGTHEMGTLRSSLDTVRCEVDAMAKQHQSIAAQMKTELEEPLAAFAGGMKERRKIVQNSIEKLLKAKVQQTQQVNKTRDKYEQECLKIKGYLAQGHMVMGQEERRNKAKLEKTQISLATANSEYEHAVKALEETTARWNREWKAAADKFQDLEEERLDFTKSSLWTFANIASTVCVSDDASCEKIRLSLEKTEVEKDIIHFITERGTGQEIPDAPKYINFCRGDINDSQSDMSEDNSYSVAQFPRSINPAFRSSSPQPSTFESHHDPNSPLAHDLAHRDAPPSTSREPTVTPQKPRPMTRAPAPAPDSYPEPSPEQYSEPYPDQHPTEQPPRSAPRGRGGQPGPVSVVPHDPYPMDGMTMLCRTAPASDRSSQPTSARSSSRESHSDYSNLTSACSGQTSPCKPEASPEKRVFKKKSGFFQNHSPFRRKSTKEAQSPIAAGRGTWHASSAAKVGHNMDRTASPEPIDANASLALGVGQNMLPVTTSDTQRQMSRPDVEESDPIAIALAELKEVNLAKPSSRADLSKPSLDRMSADHYHGIATPAPGTESRLARSMAGSGVHDASKTVRGTPPPLYHPGQTTRLGVPPPAVTSRGMKEATKKATEQTRSMFGHESRGESSRRQPSPASRPSTRGNDVPRGTSPAPARSVSPQPSVHHDVRRGSQSSAFPNPHGGYDSAPSRAGAPFQRASYYGTASPNGSERGDVDQRRDYSRPQSSYGGAEMAVQLAPVGDDPYGSQRSRGPGSHQGSSRVRSKSVADPARMYSRDGRPIMHYARALYVYQAAIPEELGFAKGDYLAVFRHQDDGWWEAEVHGGNGRTGLVPSNYLQPC